MNRSTKILAAASILLTCAVVIGVLFRHVSADEETPNGSGQQGRGDPAVKTITLVTQPFGREQVYNGSFRAREHVVLRSEISGRVSAIQFDDGDTVQKGDLLIEIDERELRAEREARAEELKLAELNADRLEALYRSNAITQRERDEAVSRRNVLAAEVRNIDVRLDRTRILAPFSGVLGFREVSLGALLQPDTEITTLQAVDPILVDFSIPERFRPDFSRGMPVNIRVSGFDQTFEGQVSVSNPQVDPMTRTVTIRAQVDNPDHLLLPGSFARVTVEQVNEEAILVPAVAVIRGLADVSVFVVDDGEVKRQVVRVGNRTDDSVEILEGLSAGAEVIVSGTQAVREGGGVNIVETSEQQPRRSE